ncbi:MAG: chorismate-binding protein, partial [Bacteroidota bacterium]
HQLISTINAQKGDNQSLASILKACFPMGSMTGAPKGMVCHWIDLLEKKKRGVYSGSLGYVDQEGNLDLNVIIRTLLYDDLNHELSLSTGGAITWDSEPISEWEECLNKAKAILQTELSD